jgi:hypothetical protein
MRSRKLKTIENFGNLHHRRKTVSFIFYPLKSKYQRKVNWFIYNKINFPITLYKFPACYKAPFCTCAKLNFLQCRTGSVSIVSDYRLDDRVISGSIPGKDTKIFSMASVSRPALGPTQLPAQWVPGSFPRDADHWPHLVPKSRMSRSYTSSLPKRLHSV